MDFQVFLAFCTYFFYTIPISRPTLVQNVSKFPHEGFMNVRMPMP